MSANFADASRRLTMLAAAAISLAAAGAPVANADLVPLSGNVHAFARAQFDAGEAPSTLRPKGLDIVFAKTPEQERALQQLLAAQQDPKSPQYHKWLSPAQYGLKYGASDGTLAAVTNWLESNGLAVGQVPAGRGHLPFFGSKAQVEGALRTHIHLFEVAGEQHYANVSAPLIPASLTSVISGIRGLNDFHPRPGVHVPRGATPPRAHLHAHASDAPDTYYAGSNNYPGYVGPTDFAIIYNLLPEYQQGITGAGVTVAIAAQSDIDSSVLPTFWSGFGVAGSNFGLPAQQFSSIAVPGGSDPGQTRDVNEDEAYLDTEILGALAPGARLILVRDADVTNAAWYAIDQNLAAILNISFGACESAQGSANAAIESMYEQAVADGITITVSSDDSGVAGCTAEMDLGTANDVKSNGFAVNGLASTPYNLAVGGTDFNDLDPSTVALYWSTMNQSGTLASAKSHIPEMVWNDSCANPVFASAYGNGDAIAFCNTTMLQGQNNPFIDISGGGSGLSSCTMTNTNGDCTGGYAQPAWQQGVLGIGNFGARAVPDVSMIASRWLMCSYDTSPCDPATGHIVVAGGTSAAAPSVAAIVALMDQTQISASLTDGRQGLLNPTLYSLAANEYASSVTAATCDASQGVIANSACVFYDVTAGSSAQPCSVANYDTSQTELESFPASTCGTESSDATGIMEIGGVQTYGAGVGFDVASGLGSIDAAALIAAFQAFPAPSGLTASVSGQTVTLTWTADASATSYDVYQGTAPGPVSSTPVKQNVTGTSTTVSGLQFGQEYVFAIAAVSATGVISPRSNTVDVTIVPAAPTGVTVAAPSTTSLNLAWTASTGASSYNIFEGTSSGGEGTAPAKTGLSGISASFTNLTPGKQYFFTVVAVDAGGSSMASAEASGTTIANPPTGFTASAGNGSVSLTWSASAGAATYNVYEGTSSSGEGTQPVQSGVSGTSVTIGGLSNGKKYYFTVAAVDAGGVSLPSGEASATPAAPKSGGGAMDWLALVGLGALLGARSRRAA